ncbi:MAG TPA: glycosyltransferase family 87 protein [Bradyrhizobium sp.]|uniref:glycosyltransferase family 87 protein n=1 Tax=Bradyrhizobium sp. TaxID=376 RepID=UPI002D7E744F|nr:glycosyltransferase family 87 protein [Bradyrhizobium sp.]HET7884663.1 glycosyltransferase family 87 protein [Bradyrhizobium sp.]
MATLTSDITVPAARRALPPALPIACLVLCMINAALLQSGITAHWWLFDENGLGIPTDFVNVWSAGRLVLDGHPALAYDWDIQKQVQVAVLGQSYPGNFAWHYPPPFLFVAAVLAHFPYAVAFVGWVAISFLPYLAVMRAIVGRAFGFLLAAAFPVVFTNTLVGQNGFLTASLIGGTLVAMPRWPVLSGICLGLLSYKPQYGLLFPLVLIAASQWRVFFTAGVVATLLAAVSWLAFGTESWQAFVHWLPMFNQAFLVEGRAPWGKLQSIFGLTRYFGGPEALAWALQWMLSVAVAVALALVWRSREIRYELKAASLAAGALLVTPYLFLYDEMVLAIAVAFLVRIGLEEGFERHELPALGLVTGLLMIFSLLGAPTGFGATLVVAALIAQRIGPWWRGQRGPRRTAAAAG